MLRRLSVVLAAFACCGFLALGCGDETAAPTTGDEDTGTNTDTGDNNDMTEPDVVENDTDEPDETVEDTDEPDESGGSGIIFAGCTADPSICEDDEVCRGGECIGAVAAEAYIADAEGNNSTYLWALQFPGEFTDRDTQECCFDYTGDGTPDNRLGALLGMLGGLIGSGDEPTSLQDTLDEAIEDGTISLLFDWMEWPDGDGAAKFGVLIGDAEQTEEGEVAQDFATRQAGDGNYTINEASVDAHGPLVQFQLAEVEGGSLVTEFSTFDIVISPAAFGIEGLEANIEISLEAALIDAELTEEDNGIHTVDGENEAEEFVGGGRLGGVVVLPELLDLLGGLVEDCTCIPGDDPLVSWSYEFDGLGGGRINVTCNYSPDELNAACGGDDESAICGAAGTICGAIGLATSFLDVDLFACDDSAGECGPGVGTECDCAYGEDGVVDSVSIGFYFAGTGANITGFTPSDEE